ncbi:Ff.00g122800.m01.CDS01 [Fusarium sp. VM40]|nr:Ff.00g122800.m01.CDS01 [Fusarium sp. VM40]
MSTTGAPGSGMYCGENTFNGALLKAQISVDTAFSGIRVELVIGSEEEGQTIPTTTAQGSSSEPSTESSAASAAVTSSNITSDLASASGLTTKSTGFTTGNSTVSHCPSSSIFAGTH